MRIDRVICVTGGSTVIDRCDSDMIIMLYRRVYALFTVRRLDVEGGER